MVVAGARPQHDLGGRAPPRSCWGRFPRQSYHNDLHQRLRPLLVHPPLHHRQPHRLHRRHPYPHRQTHDQVLHLSHHRLHRHLSIAVHVTIVTLIILVLIIATPSRPSASRPLCPSRLDNRHHP